MSWSIVNSETVDGNPSITLELKDGPYSRAMWDYSFQALYKVTEFYYVVSGTRYHFLHMFDFLTTLNMLQLSFTHMLSLRLLSIAMLSQLS